MTDLPTEQRKRIHGRMTRSDFPPTHDECTAEQHEINCWKQNAVYGATPPAGNPTKQQQETPMAHAISAGAFSRGECKEGACPVTFSQVAKPVTADTDPAAQFGYGGSAMVAASRMSYPM